jgi:hypothetical protein
MLETVQHKDNAFVTLTYDQESLPEDGSVNPKHLSSFLKKLRIKLEREGHENPIRYYGVGEYGDRDQRPHYHLALFGYENCWRGHTHFGRKNGCCVQCTRLTDTWRKGGVYVGSLTRESAAYIAGYVTKKLTDPDDERLGGRHPEFARMSRKPGIGGDAAHDIASTLLTHNIKYVPHCLRVEGQKVPLGPYLKDKVREYTGLPYAPMEANEEVQELSKAIYSDDQAYKAERLREALCQKNKDQAEYQEKRLRRLRASSSSVGERS